MSWVDRLNVSLRKSVNRGNDNIITSRSGIKADGNLDELIDTAQEILGDKVEKTARLYTKKAIYFKEGQDIQVIRLTYHLQNRLLSKIYDLHIEGQVEGINTNKTGDLIFEHSSILRKGGFRSARKNEEADNRIAEALSQLNDPLILKRIQALDLSEVHLHYSEDEEKWKILSRSIIGSSVSLVFPPITKCIEMKQQEIILLYELYRMIAVVLKNIDREN